MFTLRGTQRIKKQIIDEINKLKKTYENVVILFGFTGYSLNGAFDTNCLVGNLAEHGMDHVFLSVI